MMNTSTPCRQQLLPRLRLLLLVVSFLLLSVSSAPSYNDSLTSYTVSFSTTLSRDLIAQYKPFQDPVTGRITTCAAKNANCTTAFNAIQSLICDRWWNNMVPPEYEFLVVQIPTVAGVLDELQTGSRIAKVNTSLAANGSVLAIQSDGYYGLYPEDLAAKAASHGYQAVIYFVDNPSNTDDFAVGSMALRFWRDFDLGCPTPIFFVRKSTSTVLIADGNVVHLVYVRNQEADWLRSAEFYGLIFTPAILSIALLSILSLKKLWGKGAPCVINFSVCVLYCGLLQAILFSILISDSLRKVPKISYQDFFVIFLLFVLASISSTLLIAVKFRLTLQVATGDRSRFRSPSIIAFLTGACLCSISFIITISAIIVQAKGFKTDMAAPAAVCYCVFRIGLSVYFGYGQFHTIKILTLNDAENKDAGDKSRWMARRLGYIAAANLLNLIFTIMIGAGLYKIIPHGWGLILWNGATMLWNTIFEISAIPDGKRPIQDVKSSAVQHSAVSVRTRIKSALAPPTSRKTQTELENRERSKTAK